MNENVNILKKALFESTLQEIKEINNDDFSELCPSESFKRKIYDSYVKPKRSIKKSLIIAIAVAIITAVITISAVSAIRKPIFGFIVEMFEAHTVFSFSEETDKSTPRYIETVYSPLPSMLERGYLLEHHAVAPASVFYTFEVEATGVDINLSQLTLTATTHVYYENVEFTEKYVDKQKVYFLDGDDAKIAVWYCHDYLFNLNCHSSISWDEIERIVKETIYSEPVPVSEWGK